MQRNNWLSWLLKPKKKSNERQTKKNLTILTQLANPKSSRCRRGKTIQFILTLSVWLLGTPQSSFVTFFYCGTLFVVVFRSLIRFVFFFFGYCFWIWFMEHHHLILWSLSFALNRTIKCKNDSRNVFDVWWNGLECVSNQQAHECYRLSKLKADNFSAAIFLHIFSGIFFFSWVT